MLVICPSCGHRIDSTTVCLYGIEWGSPLKLCPNCGIEYYVDTIHEAALKPRVKTRFPIKVPSYEMFSLLLGPIFLAAHFLHPGSNGILFFSGCVFTAVSAAVLLMIFLSDRKNKKQYEQEILASKKRLSNPVYVYLLDYYGYNRKKKIFDKYF